MTTGGPDDEAPRSFDDILKGTDLPPRVLAVRFAGVLRDGGFAPVPVYDAVPGDKRSGKKPWGYDWQEALEPDPACACWDEAPPGVTNVSIACHRLRAVDIDIDDPGTADAAHTLADDHFGPSPSVRLRDGTGRRALLYTAAEGSPGKRSIKAPAGDDKIEVLGSGQQLVCFGRHWTGQAIRWRGLPGLEVARGQLPAVTEDQVTGFLDAAAAAFGWQAPGERPAWSPAADTGWRPQGGGEAVLPICDVRACLDAIPNRGGTADYDDWIKIGMAVFAATGGSAEGLDAWAEWSGSRDLGPCQQRWRGFARNGVRVTAGTLIWMARQHAPGLPLSPRDGAAGVEREARTALRKRNEW